MGVVYKARQKSLDRWVAIKLLAPEGAADPAFAQRFASEARILAALNHPHIVAIHDFGEAGGYFYLLMEYVDGQNLRQLLKTKRFTPAEALAIVPPVCDAFNVPTTAASSIATSSRKTSSSIAPAPSRSPTSASPA